MSLNEYLLILNSLLPLKHLLHDLQVLTERICLPLTWADY